jgi:hypothetical protein
MRRIPGVLFVFLIFSLAPAVAQSAAEGYHAVYMMAGYFLRAGNVCSAGAKDLIDTAFRFVSSNELKTVSRSFPRLTEEWMTEGASHFNDDLMKTGVAPACAAALADSNRAQRQSVRQIPEGSRAVPV